MNKWRAPISDFNNRVKEEGFRIYKIKSESTIVRSYHRKDFFKICLIKGRGSIHMDNRKIEINGTTLFIAKPHVPYSCTIISNEQACYTCLVTEDFLKGNNELEGNHYSQLFEMESARVFCLSHAHGDFLATIFERMNSEQSSLYIFKEELIRHQISLIIHQAFKSQSVDRHYKFAGPTSRTATLFIELLERGLPSEAQIVYWN